MLTVMRMKVMRWHTNQGNYEHTGRDDAGEMSSEVHACVLKAESM